MKLFSATLHGNARRWYDSLPDASITSMDQLEEISLGRWSIREYVYSLLNELNDIKKNEMRLLMNSIPDSRGCYNESLKNLTLERDISYSSILGHSQENWDSSSMIRSRG
jgi:hypothetical protein